MYVEDIGEGPPLLALHGLGGGAWFFSGLARRLAPDYRTIAVDLPGTGRSPASDGDFSVATWVADLGDLVRARTSEPVVILGHSMGTILALAAWAAWPDHIKALVFAGGLPEPQPAICERLAARAADIRSNGIAGWGRRAAPGIFSPAMLERQPEIVALFERLFDAQDPVSYVRCCEILLRASARPVVPTVRVPCLAVTGADDQYAPPALVAGFARELGGPVHEAVIPDCGHLPFLEAPERFAGLVKSFLRTLC